MAEMSCPKCKGEMRQYERNGVTIDQCEECRGIFLDRGELERLVEAESKYAAAQTAAAPPPQAPPAGGYPAGSYPPPAYPRRSGFWEEMFGGHHGHHGYRGHHGHH